MYIEIGPVSIVVNAELHGQPFELRRERLEAGTRSILKDVAGCLPVLKQKAYKIRNEWHLPEVARNMVRAVKMVDESTLTPMAAVAGAVADAVRAYAADEGVDFAVVNNGGDISVFNKSGRALRVGVGDINKNVAIPYILKIEGLGDHGIATSGFGGRSFTLGMADIVTVIGATGAIADAAATFICNNTAVETNKVKRKRASEIDPLTDIPDELVTVKIGELDKEIIQKALSNGLETAYRLKRARTVYDAVIFLRGDMVSTIQDNKHITLEAQDGN